MHCSILSNTVLLGSMRRASQMALPGSKSTSQYRGVTWNSIISKWVAVAWDRDAKKARAIGFFDTEEQVCLSYDPSSCAMDPNSASRHPISFSVQLPKCVAHSCSGSEPVDPGKQ